MGVSISRNHQVMSITCNQAPVTQPFQLRGGVTACRQPPSPSTYIANEGWRSLLIAQRFNGRTGSPHVWYNVVHWDYFANIQAENFSSRINHFFNMALKQLRTLHKCLWRWINIPIRAPLLTNHCCSLQKYLFSDNQKASIRTSMKQ